MHRQGSRRNRIAAMTGGAFLLIGLVVSPTSASPGQFQCSFYKPAQIETPDSGNLSQVPFSQLLPDVPPAADAATAAECATQAFCDTTCRVDLRGTFSGIGFVAGEVAIIAIAPDGRPYGALATCEATTTGQLPDVKSSCFAERIVPFFFLYSSDPVLLSCRAIGEAAVDVSGACNWTLS